MKTDTQTIGPRSYGPLQTRTRASRSFGPPTKRASRSSIPRKSTVRRAEHIKAVVVAVAHDEDPRVVVGHR